MSDPLSMMAPGTGNFHGLVRIERPEPQAMISLRGDLALPEMAQAVSQASGLALPGRRGVVQDGARSVAWMSPDELLLVLPEADRATAMATLGSATGDAFITCTDVSDARAAYLLRGTAWREVLAKLCPVDLHPASFGAGQIRRTRAGQVAVAFWISGAEEATLVCFRSVAVYMSDLLTNAARPGSDAGLYAGLSSGTGG